MPGKIMIVDDDKDMCLMVDADLRQRGFQSSWMTSAGDAFKAVKDAEFDVILTDLNMPGMSGIELCERIAANRQDVPVVVITSFGSLETAVEAMRAGAYDFVTKPIDMDVLALTLDRAVKFRRLQEEVKVLSVALNRPRRVDNLIGESVPMQSLYTMISKIADTETSVLLTGESGTGKELVAKALHDGSRRCKAPFIAVNCAALPEALLESELFGHKKGAFTDARSDRKGLLQQANTGTLFFDEIGELPPTLQPKLLRAIEERRVRPVGSDQEIKFDARIVAATNRDLERAVDEGTFRDDLFYRINVIQLELPPLRSRGADILLLAQYYSEYFAARLHKEVNGLSRAAAQNLLDYSWPGNVRELRNTIERAVALTSVDKLAVEDLPEKIRCYRGSQVFIGGDNPYELKSMEDVERRYIDHVLKAVAGNRTRAAEILGFDRKTLYRKLKQYQKLEARGN